MENKLSELNNILRMTNYILCAMYVTQYRHDVFIGSGAEEASERCKLYKEISENMLNYLRSMPGDQQDVQR